MVSINPTFERAIGLITLRDSSRILITKTEPIKIKHVIVSLGYFSNFDCSITDPAYFQCLYRFWLIIGVK